MLLFVLLSLGGCSHQFPGPLASLGGEAAPPRASHARPPPPVAPAAQPTEDPSASGIASAAAGFVGARALVVDGTTHRWDCSGLVEASLASAGCPFSGGTAALFAQAKEAHVLHRRRMPSPGDVAFFDDTYDRNGNGRRDDSLSHVAIVESVEKDGTIHLVHLGSHGVARFVMNLKWPDERDADDGKRRNDYLRVHKTHDSPRTRYLAGELWVAFASFADAPPPDPDQAERMSARSTR